MKYLGSFIGQYFKLLSADPNSLFQFLVFDEKIFVLRVGNALHQLPQAYGLTKEAVGIGGVGEKEIPTPDRVREMLYEANNPKGFQVSKPVESLELHPADIESATFKKGLLGTSLKLQFADGKRHTYRIQSDEQRSAMTSLLSKVLGERFVVA